MKPVFRSVYAPATPLRATLWLVGASTVLHLWAARSIGLTIDEAHYALYAYHLDWSYFDHPPMVGWLQALVLPFSQSDWALRLMPIGLSAASSLVLYRLARDFFPEQSPWIGFVTVALVQSGVVFQLIGLAMVPEDPLLLFGLLGLLHLKRALETGQRRQWIWLGLYFGLAGLSKYTAVLLVLAALLALVPQGGWRHLRTSGPWWAAALALVLVLPVLYWNERHGWISLAYQLHHGTKGPGWSLKNGLLSQAGQVIGYGPALYVLGMVGAVAGLRRLEHRGVRCAVLPGLSILLVFAWNSGYYLTLPHWTALGWAALSPLAARSLMTHWPSRAVRTGALASGVLSLFLIVAVYAQLLSPWLPFSEDHHPLADLYGWKTVARQAETLRREMAGQPGAAPVLFVGNWTLASRLAWYARPTPVQVLDGRTDQFTLWYGRPRPGARGILVQPSYFSDQRRSTRDWGFADCVERERIPVRIDGKRAATYLLYACRGYGERVNPQHAEKRGTHG